MRCSAIVFVALAFLAASCFTGVEGTARIKDTDVRRQNATTAPPEAALFADVAPQPPRAWAPGNHRLKVVSERIALAFTSASDKAEGLKGHLLHFDGFAPARTLTGDDATEAAFIADDGRRFFYRLPATDAERLDTLHALEIPFTVDMDLVAKADSLLRGNTYYVRTPAWYDLASGLAIDGLRHIPVKVDSVAPGDENFPLAVCFTPLGHPDAKPAMVRMSVGNARKDTRNFEVLFSFSDPRRQYPDITDDVWELIIHSRIRPGLTRQQCRLALGAPTSVEKTPTIGGIVERWSYSDGVFIIFEDGLVSRFRQ